MKNVSPHMSTSKSLTKSLSTAPLLCGFPAVGAILARRTVFLMLLLFGSLIFVSDLLATPFQWSFTGSLSTARASHTATLLQNGMVLLAGGIDDSNGHVFASAELYDPASGTWTPTGSMNVARWQHTATLLSNGKVLVAGGGVFGDVSAELYDPASGTWSFTGNLNVTRTNPSAVLLANGRVLVAAGGLKSAELYDPATGTWSLTGSTTARHSVSSTAVPLTLLADGRALLEGGHDSHAEPINTAELYDPITGSWTETGSLGSARVDHTATLLSNGLVLVAGGEDWPITFASAELYDPATGTWSFTGSLSTAHTQHTATLLQNGMVLVVSGGDGSSVLTRTTELYDPASGMWSVTGDINTARLRHTATLLPSGMVLAATGYIGPVDTNTAELYDPGVVVATTVSGRGSIEGQGDQATFSFRATQSDDRPSGSLSFSDPAAGISFANGRVRSLSINGNSADLSGSARLGDGSRVTYDVNTSDNGNGSPDTFTISLSNGYSAGGTLTRGDIQIR